MKKSIVKNLGLMLDCSRNGVMKVSQLKLFMKRLSIMGYNQFYLYIEDIYEVDEEPYFGYLRGRYSQAELKEIEDEAITLGMELIPCIQTLGHLNGLMQWPRYQKLQDSGDCLLVGDNDTYELIERMFSSLRKCLKTRKLHLGLDEVYHMGKGRYHKLHGEVEQIEIYISHLERVCKISEKYNFEPIIWGDMLYKLSNRTVKAFQSGSIFDFDEELRKRIPENLTACVGDYNWHSNGAERRFADWINWTKTVVHNDNVAVIAALWKWGSFSPRNQLSIDTTRNALKACEMCNIDTYITTTWGDDGAEASVYSMMPAIVYTACLAQGIDDIEIVKEKFRQWVGIEYDDYMLLDKLDDTPEFALGIVINKSKYHLYNDCFLSKLDSLVASHDAKDYAKYAEEIGNASERAGEYKYVFDMLSKLASVLAIKADIGIRTHNVYKNGDKEALNNLIFDYKEMISRAEAFYEAMRVRWYTENKPHGFEIQDIRIGGLIMRMKNCCRTLADYRDGKIEKIMELEDEIIPYRNDVHYSRTGVEVEDFIERDRVDRWMDMVSTNIIFNKYGEG